MFMRRLYAALVLPLIGQAEVPDRIDFARDVQPLFKQHCITCHGPEQQMGNLRLDRRRDAMRGGSIAVIAPGTSSGSRLFHKISGTRYGVQMPPTGPLQADSIEIIKRWLDGGAPWPDELAGDAPQFPQDPAAARIMAALRLGDTTAVRKMLVGGSKSVNRRGRGGSTPLMYAALYSDAAMVKALLEAGANPNVRNDAEATPLMWAIDDAEKTKLLLDAGAEIDARSNDGRAALTIAAARVGAASVVKLLLDRGAKLTSAPQLPMSDTFLGDVESLDLLLPLQGKATGLAAAVRMRCFKCLDVLLKFAQPADLSAAINTAASMGDTATFRRLADSAAALPNPGRSGFTILMRASAGEHASPEIVKALLDRGVDVNAQTQTGETALDYALRNGDTPVVALLRKAGGRANTRTASLRAQPKPASSIRDALDRSFPLLRRADEGFLRQSGCVSCHNNSLFAMTVDTARRNGWQTVESDAGRHKTTIAPYIEAWRDRVLQGVGIPGGPDTVGYILVGLRAVGYAPDEATDALAYYLLGRQRPDGAWRVQTERPPMESSDIQVTAMSLRALQAYAPKAKKQRYERAVRLAKSWLEEAQPRSTEDRSFQLLGFAWASTASELRLQAGKALLKEQRPDGGWGQIPSLPSDAYATGQAMVALRENGLVHAAAPQYQRGVRFLLDTQLEDGSWYLRSRSIPFQPHFESGFPHGEDQWISAAATNWAAMALLGGLK